MFAIDFLLRCGLKKANMVVVEFYGSPRMKKRARVKDRVGLPFNMLEILQVMESVVIVSRTLP